ncbi:hypothetical protein SJAG_02440 [Schizosaccharomyces japonicus yFS275]|uniref:Transmembrane protein 66 n=1 Tax=Schizosaccharomyces japonicus (strain yFS275 / FY16936) TaxID=402676 RepID=B6K2H1_SCHJY|nr:hypothetical protein SJAG_02440 [Schizosaccharomyces japonicus yFS275]EEB07352.1 hypothetical protein SJAG_02440 [Schizosaccharomyces japonicus yFS275]
MTCTQLKVLSCVNKNLSSAIHAMHFLQFLVFFAVLFPVFGELVTLDHLQVITFQNALSNSFSYSDAKARSICEGSPCSSYAADLVVCRHNQINVDPEKIRWDCSFYETSDRTVVKNYAVSCSAFSSIYGAQDLANTCKLTYRLEWSTKGLLMHRPWRLFSFRVFSSTILLLMAGLFFLFASFEVFGTLGRSGSPYDDGSRWALQMFLEKHLASP